MIKKLLSIIIIVIMSLALTSCEKLSGDKAYQSSRFIVAEVNHGAEYYTETIFYDVETKVMYLGVRHGSQLAITVLLNADGTPMLYQGK